jgi:hypothetical protein
MCGQKINDINYVKSENYCKLCVVRKLLAPKLLQIMCGQKINDISYV